MKSFVQQLPMPIASTKSLAKLRMPAPSAGMLVNDLSGAEKQPLEYVILFDPTQQQVDEQLAKHPYAILFPFVTVPADKVPDMNWISAYSTVVKPLHLAMFKQSYHDTVAQQYVRHCLNDHNIVQVGA